MSKGPAPRTKGYTISTANPLKGEAYTYVAQFGKENIFKIGYTVDFERRVKEFNQYIPKFEKNNLDTWSIIWTKKKENKHHRTKQKHKKRTQHTSLFQENTKKKHHRTKRIKMSGKFPGQRTRQMWTDLCAEVYWLV